MKAVGTAPPEFTTEHEATYSNITSIKKKSIKLKDSHVRWPGQTSGAFGLALIFLLLFPSREKVKNINYKPQTKNYKLFPYALALTTDNRHCEAERIYSFIEQLT